ncbi:hypothetical protein PsorP6_017252 [Peronosclerospora sorghi]|uniref:Uncharacterized protein n=1 Tax=Peronosclerospora sorghi TaxID=230839 RepID=A0ACC0WMN8_9STRA|nr:hypothetical protein PsorP6_017252 [Peronosclerospora sorghi]
MEENKDAPMNPDAACALDASNRGYRLLLGMGWRLGSGLGKREQGSLHTLTATLNIIRSVLQEEYDNITQLATSERRRLDSEVHETAEQLAAREAKSAKKERLEVEVRNMQAAFYCYECRKQYKSVTEMENHLSSYDHHHKRRLKELQQDQQKRRLGSEKEQGAKREKEQEQEQLMLQRRIAAQIQASQGTTAVENKQGDHEQGDGNKTSVKTNSGLSFHEGMKMSLKKPTKKVLAKRSIPSNPFH